MLGDYFLFQKIHIKKPTTNNKKPIPTPLEKLSKRFKGSELIKIQSYTGLDYMSIKEGWHKEHPVEVDALLTFPKKGEGPFPVVIITHSSGGPGHFNWKNMPTHRSWSKKLLKKGIAVMFLDNFSGRGVVNTYMDQSVASIWSMYIDAFMALEYLSKDPRVNIKKVGISGSSRGGMTAIMAAEKRLRDALISKDLYFAASQPRSPDCWSTGMFINPQPIKKTKVWLIHGLSDNHNLAVHCEDLAKKMQANGGDVIIDLRKGWHHSFLRAYPPEKDKGQTWYNCPGFFTDDDGHPDKASIDFWIEYDAFESREAYYKMAREDPGRALRFTFQPYYMKNCVIYDAHTEGGNKGNQLQKTWLKFWVNNLLN